MKTPGTTACEAWSTKTDVPSFYKYYPDGWEAAAQAVLASQWRPVSEPPVNTEDEVIAFGPQCARPWAGPFSLRSLSAHEWWMPIPPLPTPPEPTPEEKSREEFEEAWKDKKYWTDTHKETFWRMWKAARGESKS